MSTVTALEAKTRFGELLDRVARGEEIVITRHDKPVARIVPEGGRSLEGVRRAIQSMRENRGRMALTDKEIRDAINAGRR
jgi:prevent-host-death family protein